MKIPLSWLKEYIDLNVTPAQIAKTLTMAGLEVDAVEKLGLGCEKIVVCKVLEVQKHPQADKLCLATVTDGQEAYQVVCGASNCRPGIKTALALVGSTVLDETGKPFKIKKTKIRGIESAGMLCAPQELGIEDQQEGIIEFAEHLKEGMDVAELYADFIFEISLTPNLGHCSSLIGVARELSAALCVPVRYPEIRVKEDSGKPAAKEVSIDIRSPEGCPRYACRVIKGITVKPSPDWLKRRLEASGIRSINNVVDVTNYVMLEMGHPLHAFDKEMLLGDSIVIREAQKGEHFVTLDEKERILNEGDLLICDREKPVALAGIMGGQNSEVSESTKNLVLEAAYFIPGAIRRTSKHLGLMTDASKRFERGTDPNILQQVLDRAAMLIHEVAGGEICSGVVDLALKTFPKHRIHCRLSRINKILGAHLSVSEVENTLQRLGLRFSWDGQDVFTVDIPTFRNDLHEEIDIIEEVARIYGFGNINKGTSRASPSVTPHAPIFLFEREIRSRLINEGLQELLTCDLIGPTLLNIIQESEMPEKLWVKVLNPTSIEQSVLRTSLLPGLLQAVKFNWDHQCHDIAGFEIGRIHFKEGEQYREQSMAGIILTGKSRSHHWDIKPKDYDFSDLKGILENLFDELKVSKIAFRPSRLKTLHPGRQASIFAGDLEIGSLGEVHPDVSRRLDVPQRILFAEINLHDLFPLKISLSRMQEIPMYPGSERDWTLTLKEEAPIVAILEAVKASNSRLLENVELLDLYRSEKLGPKLKNATFRFVYRDRKKTIAQETVDKEHARIVENVLKSITTLTGQNN